MMPLGGIIDDSRAMLQIVASRIGDPRGVIYDCNVYGTGQISVSLSLINTVNTRSGLVEWSTRRSTTLLRSSLALIYEARMEISEATNRLVYNANNEFKVLWYRPSEQIDRTR